MDEPHLGNRRVGARTGRDARTILVDRVPPAGSVDADGGGSAAADTADLACSSAGTLGDAAGCVGPRPESSGGGKVRPFALPRIGRPRPAGAQALAMDVLGLVLAAVVAAAGAGAAHVHRSGSGGGAVFGGELLRLLVCVPLVAAVLSRSRSAHRSPLRTNAGREMGMVLGPMAAGGLASLVLWGVLHRAGTVPPTFDTVVAWCVLGTVAVGATRALHHQPPRRSGRRARHVLIVGTGMVAERVAQRLTAASDASVVGFVDDDPVTLAGWLGPLHTLTAVCRDHQVDHVVVAFSRAPAERLIEGLRPLQGVLPISVVPRLFDVLPATASISDLGSGLPAVSVAPATLGWWPLLVKRTMDIVGSAVGLVVLAPVLIAAAVAVRVSSPGPVILRQTRIGRDGRPFTMYKFRTMVHRAPAPRVTDGHEVADGPFRKLKDDPRVTRTGRILRRTSIDELPQLVNVLTGHMALVGPRPFVPEDAAAIDGWAARRYHVKPGVTGLWQVSGRNDVTFEEMCRLDQLYVSCWSIGLDARILLRTVSVVVAGRGAY